MVLLPPRSIEIQTSSPNPTPPDLKTKAPQAPNSDDDPNSFGVSNTFDRPDAPSVWIEFSPLAEKTGAINLGQGFPGWNPPPFVTSFAKEMLSLGEFQQYPRSAGLPLLCKKIATTYASSLEINLDWQTQVLVTVGCSEAIFLAFLALTKPDDEVILIAPAFDIYTGALKSLGRRPIFVPLILNDQGLLTVDLDALSASINHKTKALVINTPHNPTGKVFSRDELEEIANILKAHPQVKIISDEVYEHLVYDGIRHVPTASVPSLSNKTVSLYSAGKTFSVTGWKIGWAIGPEDLIKPMQTSQQWVVFSVASPLQAAIAMALDFAEKTHERHATYYSWLKSRYQTKRDLLLRGLKEAGFTTITPQGSFFISVSLENIPRRFSCDLPDNYLKLVKDFRIGIDDSTLSRDDYNFCRQMSLVQKVTAIPMSAFTPGSGSDSKNQRKKHSLPPMVRFAFCKEEELLKEACRRLQAV